MHTTSFKNHCTLIEFLVEKTYNTLYWRAQNTAYWLSPLAATEDLVQETYTRFFACLEREPSLERELTTFDGMTRYLIGIQKNIIHELIRDSQQETTTISLQTILERGIGDLEDGLQDVENHAEAMDIVAALHHLSRHQQRIIALTAKGFSAETIALYLKCSPEAIRSSLYRARLSLKHLIKKEGIISPLEGNESAENQTESVSVEKGPFPDYLPPAESKVFRLREIEHKSNKEIASVLCISETTVRAHYYRAKKRINEHNRCKEEKEKAEEKEFWTKERIEMLPEKQGALVRLHYRDGLSYKVIAQQRGCSEKSLCLQICRAKRKIIANEASTFDQGRRGHHQLPSRHYAFLTSVPSAYRTEMLLFYKDLLSVKTIAQKRGLSESAVQVRLRHGRDALNSIVQTRLG